jgi:hypothetical protein
LQTKAKFYMLFDEVDQMVCENLIEIEPEVPGFGE